MEIIKIEADGLSADELQGLYTADCKIVEKYGFLKRYRNADEYRDSFLPAFLGDENELFVAKEGSQIRGIIRHVKSADWGANERYKLTISICEPIVTKSLMEALGQFVSKKLARHGTLALFVYNNELDELVEKLGGKTQYKAYTYTLGKADIDTDMLNKTTAELQSKNSGLRMVYLDAITEEYIQQFCDLFTELHEDMPDVAEEAFVQYIITPEKQRQINEGNIAKDITHHCYMIFDGDELIAMSNVSANNKDPRFPYQFFFCVRGQYRGRGLGRWLYAAMYKKLHDTVDFEKMLVHHHPANPHAADVSKWVGYKIGWLETTYLAEGFRNG